MKVFVYGANLQGIHGAGSALAAVRHHGAVSGRTARVGASYGIPTKSDPWHTLPLKAIALHVRGFLEHASEHPGDEFDVVEIGCGLAGYTVEEIGPMFAEATPNVHLPRSFVTALDAARYRWLRAQHWSDGGPCVVVGVKGNAALLGVDCPSGARLDAVVDGGMRRV
jgi:hypothetical protein